MSNVKKVSCLVLSFFAILFSLTTYSFDCSLQEELGYYYKYGNGFESTVDEMLKSIELGLSSDGMGFLEYINFFKKTGGKLNSSIDITSDEYDSKLQSIDTVLEMFTMLKKSMNIPDEVELYAYSKDSRKDPIDAFYSAAVRRVYININNHYSFSFYQYLLIHELTHVQQHQRLGSIGYWANLFSKEGSFLSEREADTAVAKAVSCPVCMQVIEDILLKRGGSSSLGYLSCSQFREYKDEKQHCDTCAVHCGSTIIHEQLNEILPKTKEFNYQELYLSEREQRITLNYSFCGSAQDCLSTVRFKLSDMDLNYN